METRLFKMELMGLNWADKSDERDYVSSNFGEQSVEAAALRDMRFWSGSLKTKDERYEDRLRQYESEANSATPGAESTASASTTTPKAGEATPSVPGEPPRPVEETENPPEGEPVVSNLEEVDTVSEADTVMFDEHESQATSTTPPTQDGGDQAKEQEDNEPPEVPMYPVPPSAYQATQESQSNAPASDTSAQPAPRFCVPKRTREEQIPEEELPWAEDEDTLAEEMMLPPRPRKVRRLNSSYRREGDFPYTQTCDEGTRPLWAEHWEWFIDAQKFLNRLPLILGKTWDDDRKKSPRMKGSPETTNPPAAEAAPVKEHSTSSHVPRAAPEKKDSTPLHPPTTSSKKPDSVSPHIPAPETKSNIPVNSSKWFYKPVLLAKHNPGDPSYIDWERVNWTQAYMEKRAAQDHALEDRLRAERAQRQQERKSRQSR
ncbi:hypothetical protein CPB86DRAFT_790112 [Serendipita vermifera]|nr:hypothetical protein CPB86DRAFT_790112 [Serendipita vermifera]